VVVDGKKRLYHTVSCGGAAGHNGYLSLPWTPYLPYSASRRRRSSFLYLEYICCAGAALLFFLLRGAVARFAYLQQGIAWCWSLWV